MKTTITFLALFVLMMNVCFATVLTLSNDPTGGAQFSSLQAGFNAAIAGDTLLMEGTGIPYTITVCSQRWNKSLTVIGIGFNPQKQNPRRTIIETSVACAGQFILNNSGNGSKFYGIEFLSTQISCESNPSNYTFEDCQFDGLFTFGNNSVSSFTFRNCIFDGNNNVNLRLADNTVPIVSNILISNCVFDGFIEGSGNQFTNDVIDHCLFLATGTPCFNNLHFAIITNCMFMNVFPGGTTNSSYINNLCRLAGTFPPAGNTGNGNINATNPNLTTFTLGSFYSTSWNFHLQAGSAAIGTASDGTDIGVHGGTTKFNESGEVLIAPVMRSVIINNPTILPNGTLNVNINASKPSDN